VTVTTNAQKLLTIQFDLAHPYIRALHFFYVGGIGEVIIIIGMIAITLATAPPDPAKVSRFIWRPQMLQAFDEGVRRPWYQQVKLWYGVVTVIWLFLYWRFW
jgi:hypothetical protein